MLGGCPLSGPGGGSVGRAPIAVEWGGKGILVYDIDDGHAFVKRIPSPFDDPAGKVENIKGVCASASTRRLYVTSLSRLACLDLVTEKPVWVKALEGGCDRMAISPDGKVLYVPSLEGPHWNVVDGMTGEVVRKLVTGQGAHNTVWPAGGSRVFMGDLRSTTLLVADATTHEIAARVGPFGAGIRPLTVNSDGTLCFVNVNGLLGFEVGDVRTGKVLHRVEVPGRSREAPRLPEPWVGIDARREGAVGGGRRQPAPARVRRDHPAAEV